MFTYFRQMHCKRILATVIYCDTRVEAGVLFLSTPQEIARNHVRTRTFKKTQMVPNVYLLPTTRCIVKGFLPHSFTATHV